MARNKEKHITKSREVMFAHQHLMGKTLVDHIPEGELEKKNRARSWKKGYNKDHDMVVISTDGTVGDVYVLQDLKIALPAVPKDPSKIRFHGVNYREQRWSPYDIPKELLNIEKETVDWNSRPENKNNPKTPTEIFYMKPVGFVSKYEKVIDAEFDRRANGAWVYINMTPIWIPPSHYYMLQYNTVSGTTRPDFRFTNRDYYLFWEACKADDRSLGMIYLKNRRSGASTMAGSEALNIGSSMSEGFLGIMSKTNRDSVSFLNRMVIRPFKKTPWFFKPQTSGTTSATSGLNFREIASKISAKNTTMTADEGLDTSIKQFSTSLNSMDGEKVHFMVLDECFGAGFKVRMYDGSVKRVEDISVGDVVMGDDSTPREVLRTMTGEDQMYEVTSKFGSYTCNSRHKIRLNHSYYKESFLTPIEYMDLEDKKARYFQEERRAVEYNKKNLPIDPYLFGIWLGDGDSDGGRITTADIEIDKYLNENHDIISSIPIKRIPHVKRINVKGLRLKIKSLGVFKNKHIPEIYKKSSVKDRMSLLAGLIDTDGYADNRGNKTRLEISMSREHLIDDIIDVAVSLGFNSKKSYKKTHCVIGERRIKCDAWRAPFEGNTWDIPLLIERKKRLDISGVKGRRSPNKSGIRVKEVGVGKYFGFTLDNNNLFLSENNVIHKNCGKYPTDVPFDQYWSISEECLTEGFQVIGKAMCVSTVNSQAKGGKEYKDIYYASNVNHRMDDGKTATGLYSFFIPAEWNQAGGYDIYGYSVVDNPRVRTINAYGHKIKKGNLNRLIDKGTELKKRSATLYNEFLRKHPRTEAHAFRDESSASDFDLNKLYEQQDSNEMLVATPYERGNFVNVAESGYKIEWRKSKYGRFYVSWLPPEELRNNFAKRGNNYYPLNTFGCFGVDPYKVSQTADGRGSDGSAHFMTGKSANVTKVPYEEFVMEYIERPATVEMFMRDMMLAMLYYGCPALIENNVPNLLENMSRAGLTHFALRRKDKLRLTLDEKKYGGIPMTSEKVRQDHYFAIQTYIINHVGEADDDKYRDEGQMGRMPFNRTLSSWSKFNPLNRTSEDASISSGLAIMGNSIMGQKAVRGSGESKKSVPLGIKYRY